MNARILNAQWPRRVWRAVAIAAAVSALSIATQPTSYADAPNPTASFPDAQSLDAAQPVVAEPGIAGTAPMLDTAPMFDTSPDAEAPSIDALPGQLIARPTRVWTTDIYRRLRTTFWRGETIVFWVQLYNPTRSYVRHPLELWVDDQIRCFTTPCDGGPQRLYAGTLWVRPGYTNYYKFARSEPRDKIGQWDFYATDPNRETFLATKFYLR